MAHLRARWEPNGVYIVASRIPAVASTSPTHGVSGSSSSASPMSSSPRSILGRLLSGEHKSSSTPLLLSDNENVDDSTTPARTERTPLLATAPATAPSVTQPLSMNDLFETTYPLHFSFFIPSNENGTQGRWISLDAPPKQPRSPASLVDMWLSGTDLYAFPSPDWAGRVPHAIACVAHLRSTVEEAGFDETLQLATRPGQTNLTWFLNVVQMLASAQFVRCSNELMLLRALEGAAEGPFDGNFFDCSLVCGPVTDRPEPCHMM